MMGMAEEESVILVLLVLGAILVLPILFMAFLMPVSGMMGTSGWGMTGWGIGLFGLGWLFPLLFLALVGWAVYRIATGGGIETDGEEDRAIDLLRESYARGDIDDEEFERRLRTLRNE